MNFPAPPRDLARDAYRLFEAEGPHLLQMPGERVAVDEGHDEVGQRIAQAGVEQGKDVGVAERCHHLDLAHESAGLRRVEAVRVEHFDRDAPAQRHMLGAIDRARCALADLLLDQEALAEQLT